MTTEPGKRDPRPKHKTEWNWPLPRVLVSPRLETSPAQAETSPWTHDPAQAARGLMTLLARSLATNDT